MTAWLKSLAVGFALVFAPVALGAGVDSDAGTFEAGDVAASMKTPVDQNTESALLGGSSEDRPLIAQKRKRGRRKARKGRRRGGGKKGRRTREKHITREKVVKGKDATDIDFDAVDISGQRKTPMGTLINQNKANKNYDFVKIRRRWHPEMIQSASSLDNKKK